MASGTKIKDWSAEERPREKMMLNGAKSLSNSELLAILIRSGDTHSTAVDLAKSLLSMANNSLKRLSEMGVEELCSTKGIGITKAASLLAMFELSSRISGEPAKESPQITCAMDAVSLMRPIFNNLRHEECWVIYLNRQNRVLHKECVSKGGTHSTVIDPKIIFKRGIDKLAAGIILLHNHPSGNPYPGEDDRRETRMLKDASIMLDISLIDHIIIAGEKYFSFSENTRL